VREGFVGLMLGGVLPVLLFYGVLRTVSFGAAVGAVLVWSALVFVWHRRRTGGADVFSGVTFALACVHAAVGLLSSSTTLYLAWPSVENLLYGTVFLGSALLGRPLLAVYARRLYPNPAHVQASPAFRHAFTVASFGWFVGLLARGMLRLWLLNTLPLELYLVANTVSGWPFSGLLVAFTVWYPLWSLRRAGLMAAPKSIDLEDAAELPIVQS
jgi:hypothetical protein